MQRREQRAQALELHAEAERARGTGIEQHGESIEAHGLVRELGNDARHHPFATPQRDRFLRGQLHLEVTTRRVVFFVQAELGALPACALTALEASRATRADLDLDVELLQR